MNGAHSFPRYQIFFVSVYYVTTRVNHAEQWTEINIFHGRFIQHAFASLKHSVKFAHYVVRFSPDKRQDGPISPRNPLWTNDISTAKWNVVYVAYDLTCQRRWLSLQHVLIKYIMYNLIKRLASVLSGLIAYSNNIDCTFWRLCSSAWCGLSIGLVKPIITDVLRFAGYRFISTAGKDLLRSNKTKSYPANGLFHRIISAMIFTILARRHFYIETGPKWVLQCQLFGAVLVLLQDL